MVIVKNSLKRKNTDPVLSFMSDIDELMPAERLDRILVLNKDHRTDDLRLSAYHLLMGLYGINQVMRKKTGADYFFYIQNDASLLNLMDMCGLTKNLPKNVMTELIVALGNAQLIYRFNAALKFDLTNQKVKQLRINSWGRSLLEEGGILIALQEDTQLILKEFGAYVDAHKSEYRHLADILLKPITPALAEDIREINKNLFIQIVS